MLRGLKTRTGPDLSRLGQRVYAGWIDRWLADPRKLRPDTAMPKLFANDEASRTERHALPRYLVSLGGPTRSPRTADDNEVRRSAGRGRVLFNTIGCVACHPDEPPAAPPNADETSFHGLPDLSGIRSTYQLGATGNKWQPDRLVSYLANPLTVNPSGRMPNMVLQF